MRRGRDPAPARFAAADRGSSAVEFALIFPVLLILMLFGVQVVTYVNAVRRVEKLAASMSQMLSQPVPPQGSTTATVNAQDIHFAFDSGLVIFPYLMSDGARKGIPWWQDIEIDFASIQFTQIPATTCPSNGDQSPCYLANVVWTTVGTTGGNYRPCVIPQTSASDTASPSRTSIPRSIFGPGSIIAVDVVFTFTPTFATKFMPPMTISRSVYIQPRYASLINYDTTNNDGIATKCPGY